MNTRPSRILRQLRANRLCTLWKVNLADPKVVEIAGLCGADAVWLCTEHVSNDWITLENQIRAARVEGIDSLVRVARGSYSDYIKPLEADATGIIVPHIASVEEARAVIESVRFFPLGKRAIDGGNIDGRFSLLPVHEYINHANTERIVVLQIESPEGLEQVEKIAALPGFNALFFGRNDFCHRIGKPGQLGEPEVVAARKRIATAARRNGKFAFHTGPIASLAEVVDEGHSVFAIGADVIAISSMVTDKIKNLQGLAATLPPDFSLAGPGDRPRGNSPTIRSIA